MADGKTRRSVSIDTELDEELQRRDEINVSGMVNEFLRRVVFGGETTDEVVRDIRRSELKAELTAAKYEQERADARIARIQNALERLDAETDDLDPAARRTVNEWAEKIESGEFNGDLEPDNKAMKQKAGNVGLSPERFVREVEARIDS